LSCKATDLQLGHCSLAVHPLIPATAERRFAVPRRALLSAYAVDNLDRRPRPAAILEAM